MVFGFLFGKKKDPADDSRASGRQRRMIQSQRTSAVKPGQAAAPAERKVSGPQQPIVPVSGPVETVSGPVKAASGTAQVVSGPAQAVSGPTKAISAGVRPATAASRQDVGQLKRGEAAALKAVIDTEQADTELRDFLLQISMGEPAKVAEAFDKRSEAAPFIRVLVDDKVLNENDLMIELSKKCMIPQVKLAKYVIRKKALDCLSPDMARKAFMLPLDKLGQILSVAMVNPLNKAAQKTVATMTGLRIKTVVCTYSEFMEQFNKHYVAGGEVMGSEEALEISIEEAKPISPEEFRKSMGAAVAKPAPSAGSTAKLTTPGPKPATAVKPVKSPGSGVQRLEPVGPVDVEMVKGEEVVPQDTTNVLNVELIDLPADAVIEESLLLEPLSEGISLAADEDEVQAVIEQVIITSKDREEKATEEEPAEYIEAVRLVEEEFNQGITLGAVDLFKKWENLHRKNRIITLKMLPADVFSFVTSAQQ
ncbi:MAG: hypothetical protein ABIF71_12640 [Planctomycetota bacterium]